MVTTKQGFPQPADGDTSWGAGMRTALAKLDDSFLLQGGGVTNYLMTAGTYPAGTTAAQWAQLAGIYIGPSNNLLLSSTVLAQTPTTPAPVQSVPGQWLALGFAQLTGEFVASNGAFIPNVAPNNVTAEAIAEYLTMAVLQRDQAAFDKVGEWAKTNMLRGKSGSGQTIALNLLGRNFPNNTGTMSTGDYIINSGAELRRLGAYIRAWNLWGRVADRDTASKIGSDIVNRLVFKDEGRAYLVDNEFSVNPVAHHTFNSAQWIKVNPGDINPIMFRLAKTFFGGTIWDQLIEGYYDIIVKSTANSGGLATTTGLVPEVVAYENAGHSVSAVTNGVNGWTETGTTDFTQKAAKSIAFLWADKKLYNEPRAAQALDRMLDFFLAEGAANSYLFKTQYTHAGVAVGSVTNVMRHYWYYRFMLLNDGNTAGADGVLTSRRHADMASNAFGRYWPDLVISTTAASSRDGNLHILMLNAIDNGTYNDIGLLGSNPTSGTILPIGGGTLPADPGTGGGVVIVPSEPNTTPPPTGLYPLYADPSSLMKSFANGIGDATAKARVMWAADTPQAFWSGIEWDNNCDGMKAYIDAAAAKGQVAQVLSYSIPGRDLGQYSAGGAANRAAYEVWIGKFAAAIGTRRVIVAYEPDSLVHAAELSAESRAGRMSIMKWAMSKIKTDCPNAYVYVDVGHPAWKSVDDATALLREVGVEVADGFVINVSNFRPDPECITYGQAVRGKLNMPGVRFVFDTGRNGNPIPNEGWDWANPIKRQYGRTPQFGNSGVTGCDGWMWWKRPGESDGNNWGPLGQAPNAGEFFQKYIYNFEVPDNSDLAGMSQRPPTPLGGSGTGTSTGSGTNTPINGGTGAPQGGTGSATTPTTGGTGGSGLGGGSVGATTLSWYTYGVAPSGITLDAIKTIFLARYGSWKTYTLTQTGMPSGMPGGAWRVKVPDENDGVTGQANHTVSEGIGYGMLLTAYCSRTGSPIYDANAKAIFDGLWTYYKFFRKSNGLMNWKISSAGNVIGTGGATDGDLDVAMALVIMSRLYPGTASYATDARALINAIRDYEFTPVNHPSGSNIMTNGDQWGFDADRYMADYLRPGWFREFAFHNSDARWLDIAIANYPRAIGYFYNNFPNTGYVPDQSSRSGASIESIVPGSYKYGYNSIRMPFGLVSDVLWNNNAIAKDNLTRLANSERNRAGQDPNNTKAEGNLTGTAFAAYTNLAYVSGFGVAGTADAATAAWAKSCIDWVNTHTENSYFGQCLSTLALLVLTGEMKPYR